MGFESLLGNARLKENLTASLARGNISHFYLISGPKGSGKHTLAKLLACSILCQGMEKPCECCEPCRKVLSGNHPDVITVEDPEHKTVAVKLVRQAREDVYIRPNESDYKIYLFPQELGIEGQNALLKILEEPPAYGVFILLTDNPEKLLPTVRSRCRELALTALPRNQMLTALAREYPKAAREDLEAAIHRSGGYLGQAKSILAEGDQIPPQTENFVRSFAARDAMGLTEVLVPMEKWKRDQLIPILESWVELMEEALAFRAGMPAASALSRQLGNARSTQDLMQGVNLLKKALDFARSNVATGAVCGWLCWALR